MLGKAVAELLESELSREFAPLDIKKKIREFKGESPLKWMRDSFLDEVLSSLDLRFPNDDKSREFKDYVVSELKKTEHPITLNEYLRMFAGTDEEKRKEYATGEPAKKYSIVHLNETSPEFKMRVKEWHVNNIATKVAIREYSPQFNLLYGLLRVVHAVGDKKGDFAGAYSPLKKKAEEGRFQDMPRIDQGSYKIDVFEDVLCALARLQIGIELRQLWLDGMKKDPKPERLNAYIHGVLSMYKRFKERRAEIPAILAAIEGREVSANQQMFSSSGIGFVVPVNLLDIAIGRISEACFKNRHFHYIDSERGAFRFYLKSSFREGVADFAFASYTKGGASLTKGSLDLKENIVGGNPDAEKAIRAYVEENGYPVSSKLHITSLEGKSHGKSLVTGEELNGKFEGIIGLNTIKVAFSFDPQSDALLVSLPFSSGIPFGMSRTTLADRRMGEKDAARELGRAKKLQLMDVGQISALINDEARDKLAKRHLFDASYHLYEALNGNDTQPIAQVIRHVLVERGEGLWQ
jgi:hypothetical protein